MSRNVVPHPSTQAPADLLAVVEAAYDCDASFSQWATGVLRALSNVVAGGSHGFICTWRRTAEAALIDSRSVVALDAPEEMLAVVVDGLTKTPPPWMSDYLRYDRGPTRCALTSEVDRTGDLAYRSRLAAEGIADGMNLTAADPDDFGFLVSFAVPPRYRLPSPARSDLRRVATHVMAGLRLRRRLGIATSSATPVTSSILPAPEAVLSPDGGVLHADGEAKLASARRALSAAVRGLERARDSRSDRPREALRRWRGLVAARWSLVDSFEAGGQRYVLARENQPPPVGSIPALTRTEASVIAYVAGGFTTKEVAYTLGVSDATIRVLLMRAARRCGVSSRNELLDLWHHAQAGS